MRSTECHRRPRTVSKHTKIGRAPHNFLIYCKTYKMTTTATKRGDIHAIHDRMASLYLRSLKRVRVHVNIVHSFSHVSSTPSYRHILEYLAKHKYTTFSSIENDSLRVPKKKEKPIKFQQMICDFSFLFRFFFRRKWLPPPLRKLSQGKVDKTTSATERPLVKKGSEKTFKLASADKLATSIEEVSTSVASVNSKSILPTASSVQPNTSTTSTSSGSGHQTGELEAEEEVAFELPPPMKPIQDSQAIINNGPNVSSATVAEQSPCKRVRSIHNTLLQIEIW